MEWHNTTIDCMVLRICGLAARILREQEVSFKLAELQRRADEAEASKRELEEKVRGRCVCPAGQRLPLARYCSVHFRVTFFTV